MHINRVLSSNHTGTACTKRSAGWRQWHNAKALKRRKERVRVMSQNELLGTHDGSHENSKEMKFSILVAWGIARES